MHLCAKAKGSDLCMYVCERARERKMDGKRLTESV